MRTRRLPATALLLAAPLGAQRPYARAVEGLQDPAAPVLHYTLRVDPQAPGYDVELRVDRAPDTLRLALPIWAPGAYRVAAFHRNVRGVEAASGGRALAVAHPDSSRWTVVVPRDSSGRRTVVVRYRIRFASEAAARTPNNRSFVRETGALVDGPQAWVYPEGHTDAPAHVRLELPAGWRVATGLVPTSDSTVFYAPSWDVLADSPILLGDLHLWRFDVSGVPHRVAFWTQPGAPAFDSTRFVDATRRVVEAARGVMGWLPYREYTFLYVDGVGGGLEHLNSTTIGTRSTALARDPLAAADVTAHEFFHLWNVKRVRPVALGPFDYQHVVRSRELWWSEGVTDYFGEELQRRAGLMTLEQSRDALAGLVASYANNPAHARLSPERSSYTVWDAPSVNAGYEISYYLQGALLGALLELRLREATAGRRGMDDVMRRLMARHAGERGFTGADLERAVAAVCGCDVTAFFDAHVRRATPIDWNRELAPIGWRLEATRAPAVDSAGRPLPDLRIGASAQAGYGSAGGAAGGPLRLTVGDPTSAWGRAGLQSRDELVSWNGQPVATPDELRALLARVRLGDTVTVVATRGAERRTARVVVGGYERTRVRLVDAGPLTDAQRRMRRAWMTGRP